MPKLTKMLNLKIIDMNMFLPDCLLFATTLPAKELTKK